MGSLPAGDRRRLLRRRLFLRPPVARDARRARRPDRRLLGRLGLRGLGSPRPAGRRPKYAPLLQRWEQIEKNYPRAKAEYDAKLAEREAQPPRPRPRASRPRRAQNPDDQMAGNSRPGQHLQRRAQADDRLRHPGRHLVPGRIERRPGLPVSRPVPADDQELARRVGPGRFPVLLGPARRLHGREARAAQRAPGPSCARPRP